MRIGVPREIKVHEYRVGLVPAAVREIVEHGHEVMVQSGAGLGVGAEDDHYRRAGGTIVGEPAEIFAAADMIVKVKEPQAAERRLLRAGQVLFTFLHLAPDRPQTTDLIESGALCIAYETVTDSQGHLPLLAPMSEVAGRMSIQAGAHCLEKVHQGRGVLLGGVPGVEAARVVILGGGVVGSNAAQIASGMGADVTVLDRSLEVLRRLDQQFGHRVRTVFSTADAIEQHVLQADLVVGGVLVPGAAAPKLISAQLVSGMHRGSVLVDVAIDQGGCFATSRPTTHAAPTFLVDEVVHYCVANMPGAVARTSTYALNHATLPFVLELADHGVLAALRGNPHLRDGLATCHGRLTSRPVAEVHGLPFTDPLAALAL